MTGEPGREEANSGMERGGGECLTMRPSVRGMSVAADRRWTLTDPSGEAKCGDGGWQEVAECGPRAPDLKQLLHRTSRVRSQYLD